MSRLMLVMPLLLLVLSAGCIAGSTPSVESSPTPSAEASEVPIPDELIGDWETRKGTDPVVLTLRANGSYSVKRGLARGMGAMGAANARQLDFFGGDPCPERGSYEWTIEGETLTFTSVSEDECPGRAAVLDGLTYTRAGDG